MFRAPNLTPKKLLLFCILVLGKNKQTNIENMSVEQNTFNSLGVCVGRNEYAKQNKNFADKLPKVKTLFQIYWQRDISICGKILITKTLGISKFTYPLTSTDNIYKQYIKILQTEFNKYIWGYKPAKVKHNALIGDYEQGGLKSIDIATNVKALRLPWMCRIIQGEEWKDIVNLYLKPIGGLLFLLRCNYDTAVLPFIPTFYKNMLDHASEIMFKHLGQNIIWNNGNILVDGKSIFFREWYEKGVVFLNNLCDENGVWLSFDTFCNTYNVRINFLRYLGSCKCSKKCSKTY